MVKSFLPAYFGSVKEAKKMSYVDDSKFLELSIMG